MRVLYLSHCLPYPPNKGDRVRAYHALEQLSLRHQIHLLAISKSWQDSSDPGPLEALCTDLEIFPIGLRTSRARALAAVPGKSPFTLSYFRSGRLSKRIAELRERERFDVVVAYSSAMAPYAMMCRDTPRVLDMIDVDSEKWRQYSMISPLPMRQVYAMEARRLRAYERQICESFDQVVVTTAREVELLQALSPGSRVSQVRNGVRLDYFASGEGSRSEHPTLVFTGQMDYLPNVDGMVTFVDNVFPLLEKRFPDLELQIVGRCPTRAVRRLGTRSGVVVTGEVPDIRPYLDRAWVFVAPLRIAQGIQNKVLEALAMGLPVMCSQAVAGGLVDSGFESGGQFLVGKSTESWLQGLTELLRSATRRDRVSNDFRRSLQQRYDWATNLREFDKVLAAAVSRGPN